MVVEEGDEVVVAGVVREAQEDKEGQYENRRESGGCCGGLAALSLGSRAEEKGRMELKERKNSNKDRREEYIHSTMQANGQYGPEWTIAKNQTRSAKEKKNNNGSGRGRRWV